ncbi:MAG TPA: aminopeptidase P N-terminal domain-containing protein, partial [Acidobacteriota bacterium]
MSIFEQRRKRFMSQMQDGVAVFFAAPVRRRNNDVDYDYRQDSDFYYLTGFEEPESVFVLAPSNPVQQYTLFVLPRDPEKETWTGIRNGVEGAIKNFGANRTHTINELFDVLPQLLQNNRRLYYTINRNPEADQTIFKVIDQLREMHRTGIYPPNEIVDPLEILSEMRLIKTPDDLEILQKAIDLSVKGHVAAMKMAQPGKFEYEIQAVLEYIFRSGGSTRNGYPCIVGSGPATCILHYTTNNRKMSNGDLLLIDAGAEFGYFTGDVTRTYPVNGKFSAEQKAVYEIVLDAQKNAIQMVRPGNTFMQVHEVTIEILTEGLVSLGLLKGTISENIEKEEYKKYFMHRTSHWLGMDVHDVGKYRKNGEWRVLQEGMVLTVEPGLYIGANDDVEKFRNIGIRIEDDVLVTAEGPVVLSKACPKEISDLE